MLEIMNPSKLQHITHSDSYNFLFQIAVTLDLVTSLRASILTHSLQLLQCAVQWPPSAVSSSTSASLSTVHNLVNHSLCVLALLIKALSQVTGKTIFINLAVHLQSVCVSLFSSKDPIPLLLLFVCYNHWPNGVSSQSLHSAPKTPV